MWLCSACGLAQLVADPTVPEEPKGAEPAALIAQAADAVGRVAAAGLLPPGGTVTEYGSPHGGSWLRMLVQRGLQPVYDNEPADMVLDCFGLMHESDQSAAVAERVSRVSPGGVLLLQYHSLSTIILRGQWNALRHGHYAYYSSTTLATMLAAVAFRIRMAWQFELYGGTVLLAASREGDTRPWLDRPMRTLLTEDARVGVRDPAVLGGLQRSAQAQAKGLRDWLLAERSVGKTVLGYGAASRAVALLRRAGVDRELLPAVVDASSAKQGLRMPGTDIPVVNPAQLGARQPDAVLLFLADLLNEVRAAYPEVEAAGGRWIPAEALGQ
jgi:hypothetical protein